MPSELLAPPCRNSSTRSAGSLPKWLCACPRSSAAAPQPGSRSKPITIWHTCARTGSGLGGWNARSINYLWPETTKASEKASRILLLIKSGKSIHLQEFRDKPGSLRKSTSQPHSHIKNEFRLVVYEVARTTTNPSCLWSISRGTPEIEALMGFLLQ